MASQAQTNGQGRATQQQSAGLSPSASVLSGYLAPLGAYDELNAEPGQTRPAWERLEALLDRLGQREFRHRWDQSQALIRENGIEFSAFGEAENRPKAWSLDPLPLVLSESEWAPLRAGLEQRATLLEAILQDLYGPQELLRSGVLPAELLLDHPGYRLPLNRPPGATSTMLDFYAADVCRAPDGKWWVLADRTEAPSGVGFALENRIVTSRMLAEAFRDSRVKRLAPFFLQLQAALQRSAPGERANASIAILSQGTGHPNYFEDAYLARYLGVVLTEAGDLTVRNRQVWMKTLDGLTPIDVLVRRLNTENCDPLELRGAGGGVAGLLQSSREGAVSVFNRLGSGLVESPLFMAFMPRLCQALLSETLKLPGVASWWCGEAASLEFVLKNLDRLVLKRAYRQRGVESLLTAELEGLPRAELIERIKAEPRAYVAQERVNRSATPAYRGGSVESVRLALRAFAVATPDGYKLMDGALGRTTSDIGPLEASVLAGEGSKDVWIVGDKPVPPITLLPDEQTPLELVRLGAALPSRVAENSFWLGRNLERGDAAARLVRTVATRLTGEGDASDFPELSALMRGLAEQGQIEPGYAVETLRGSLPSVDQALPGQVLDATRAGSLSFTLGRMFNAASQVRDRLSRDAWRVLVRTNDRLRSTGPQDANLTELLSLTDELVVSLSAVGGMVVEGMTRTQFYRFMDIGRRVERAMQLTELLRTCLIECADDSPPLLVALLESADSLMTYRARYRASVRLAAALDLLVTDETNPRSLAFQVNTLERHVGKLPRTGDTGSPGQDREQRIALKLKHAVQMIDIVPLSEAYELGQPGPLGRVLGGLATDLPRLADAIMLKYFAHSGPQNLLSPV